MFMLYISLIIRCNCRPLWLSAFLFGFSLRALKHNNWFYLRSSLLNKKTQFWYLCFFNYVSARYDCNILFWLHYYSGNYDISKTPISVILIKYNWIFNLFYLTSYRFIWSNKNFILFVCFYNMIITQNISGINNFVEEKIWQP